MKAALFAKLVILLVFVSFNCIAQDSIQLLSGQTYPFKLDSISNNLIYGQLKKGKKWKPKLILKDEAFSISKDQGKEIMLYSKSVKDNREFSVDQMRYFLFGKQDATKHYKGNGVGITSFVLGAASGYLLHNKIGVAVIPVVIPITFGLFPINYRKVPPRSPDIRSNEFFQAGYTKKARGKKVFSSFKYSLIGAAAGIFAGFAIN